MLNILYNFYPTKNTSINMPLSQQTCITRKTLQKMKLNNCDGTYDTIVKTYNKNLFGKRTADLQDNLCASKRCQISMESFMRAYSQNQVKGKVDFNTIEGELMNLMKTVERNKNKMDKRKMQKRRYLNVTYKATCKYKNKIKRNERRNANR